jgi:hypothetical protein
MHLPPTALVTASLHQLRLMWQQDIADNGCGGFPERRPSEWTCRVVALCQEETFRGADLSYSITSSASAYRVGGTVMPSVLAALRLSTSSNRVGCSIGSSPGSVPFNILSTYEAARR